MSTILSQIIQFYDSSIRFVFLQNRFLLRRALEVIVGTNLLFALIQQWIVPGIVNSLIPFSVSSIPYWT